MCKTKYLIAVLIFISISKSLQLTVHCEYKNSSSVSNGPLNWEIVKDTYACVIETLDVKSKLYVTNITGTHINGYTNGNVRALKIIGGGTVTSDGNTNSDEIISRCEIIPSGFGSMFSSIEALSVSEANLKSVSNADLKQFANLREIWILSNNLEYLESTLFQYNENVAFISFSGNKIKYIGEHFFNFLPKLLQALFYYNECIDDEATVVSELSSLKQKIKEKCAVNENAGSLQVTVDCKFEISSDWKMVKDPYGCNLLKLALVNKLSAINATGKHIYRHRNDDVKAIKIYNGICHIIPSQLGIIFPNIEALSIRNASLKHVSSPDLQQFPNLKEIWLYGNDIDYLESNLFEYNPKVEVVVIKGNKIKYVGGKFFDFLPNLRQVDFSDNECIDEKAADATKLSEIKKKIKQKCVVMGKEPRGYTTIREYKRIFCCKIDTQLVA